MAPYLLLAGVVFGVNLLPAFGPPTWAILVWFEMPATSIPSRSPLGIVLQVATPAALVVLVRVDWVRIVARRSVPGPPVAG